jgi:adenosylhomocysteine nucleosidase
LKKPILIIGAMDPEIDFLVSKLENSKKEKINGYNMYEGTIKNYPVVIAQSEVGIINSSVSTTLAIEKYQPLLIINEGTAGGLGNKIHKADIVIGEECFNIMSAKTPYKEIGEGSNSLEWDYITFVNGGKDEKKTIKADSELVKFVKNMEHEYEKGKVYTGVIGSGDIWNCEKDKIMYLNEKHGVLCEEMEGIAVYTVASQYNIPVVGIRVISDNEILGEEYDRNLGLECQKFVYEIVNEMIENKLL